MVVHVISPAITRLALAGFVLAASSSSAQTVTSQTTLPPRTSFADLLRTVEPGDPVTVTDAAGNRIRGEVLRTSNSSFEILEDRQWPWSRRHVIAYAEPAVVKVAHHDSPWQGTALGLGAGIVLGLAVPLFCKTGEDCAWEALRITMWAPLVFASVGTAIDDAIERTRYDSGRRSALAEEGRLYMLARAGIGGADLGRGIEAMRGAGGSVGYWVTPRQGFEVETWLLPTRIEDYGEVNGVASRDRIRQSLLNFNVLMRLRALGPNPFVAGGVGFVLSQVDSERSWPDDPYLALGLVTSSQSTRRHTDLGPVFTVGGGVSIPLWRHALVVPEIRVSFVDRSETYPRATLGVAYRFRK